MDMKTGSSSVQAFFRNNGLKSESGFDLDAPAGDVLK